MRKNNIRIIGIPEEERVKGIVDKNFPNYGKSNILESKRQTECLMASIQKRLLQGTLY